MIFLKKIFETIGFISLICFSFFYTNKISLVIKENDDIIKQIKDIKSEYEIKPIDAKINNDEIIPGKKGSSIDVNKSYEKMKQINTFNDKLLVYKDIYPNISVNKKYDKYIISGNESKKEISIIFILKENENIDSLLKILNKYNIKSNFFVSINWFTNNNEEITTLINEGHIIGNFPTDDLYLRSSINWMNGVVSKINKQTDTFCYNKEKDNNFLNICNLNKSYTIKPSLEIFDNPSINIKNSIKNGSIIALEVNNKVLTELPFIIEYINSRGFNIVTLSKLIEE